MVEESFLNKPVKEGTQKDSYMEFPIFDQPQRPAPNDSLCTYQEAVRAFEEIILHFKLNELPSSHRTPVATPFVLKD